ncbi:uncharacterized protein LOC116205742 [Punica granatum]|uniref:Senescence regulator S40 n=2 Tax=Punica granatum TaxID=22663 RepID=A0A218WKB2_PUNGR|nr:uncharacterized protein LOC116205742 [Punica granatum]OWM73013.1 hypothetical protein CDL15_Pgr001127 [Punica granatum]PKI69074.1 hypothetical protein CRG98_010543 [Punica granatum]
MDLEFQESDIIFSSDHQSTREVDDNSNVPGIDTSARKGRGKSKKSLGKKTMKKMMIQSVPVDIPCNFFQHKREPGNRDEFYDYYDDDEEMVPPHMIVGRRIAGKIAFSVCTGIGRTLKGRDLSEVRNSILRLTGFLES